MSISDAIEKTSSTRQSNMELLRIVAITMVIFWHYFINGGFFEHYAHTRFLGALLVNGVDLFILISGWFLIKCKFKSILKLIITILVIELFKFIFVLTGHVEIPYSNSYQLLRIIFASPFKGFGWFMPTYFALVFISPLLNMGLKNLTLKQLRICILGLSFMEFYEGWLLRGYITDQGYSIFSLIFVYSVGHWLRRETESRDIKTSWLVFIAIICFIINSVFIIYNSYNNEWDINVWPFQTAFIYNNPFLILFCCCILLLFTKIKIQSNTINLIASAVFGCFLLHSWNGLAYSTIEEIFNKNGILGFLTASFLFYIITWPCALFFSKISIFLTNKIYSFTIKAKNLILSKLRLSI